MKLNSDKMTYFLSLPLEEAGKIIKAMKQAERINDIDALKWCIHRLIWLADISETERGDDEFYSVQLFNKDWKKELKNDPPPKNIAGIFKARG